MLREMRNTRQISREHPRRWYMDEDMDLIVWFGEAGSIVGFQLAYDQLHSERALTWKFSSGFHHEKVDDGEDRPGKYKATPILIPDGKFPASLIAERFKVRAENIDDEISNFVYNKLLEYPEYASES